MRPLWIKQFSHLPRAEESKGSSSAPLHPCDSSFLCSFIAETHSTGTGRTKVLYKSPIVCGSLIYRRNNQGGLMTYVSAHPLSSSFASRLSGRPRLAVDLIILQILYCFQIVPPSTVQRLFASFTVHGHWSLLVSFLMSLHLLWVLLQFWVAEWSSTPASPVTYGVASPPAFFWQQEKKICSWPLRTVNNADDAGFLFSLFFFVSDGSSTLECSEMYL